MGSIYELDASKEVLDHAICLHQYCLETFDCCNGWPFLVLLNKCTQAVGEDGITLAGNAIFSIVCRTAGLAWPVDVVWTFMKTVICDEMLLVQVQRCDMAEIDVRRLSFVAFFGATRKALNWTRKHGQISADCRPRDTFVNRSSIHYTNH